MQNIPNLIVGKFGNQQAEHRILLPFQGWYGVVRPGVQHMGVAESAICPEIESLECVN